MAARVRRALGDVARGIAVAVRARPGLALGAAAAVFALSILLPPADFWNHSLPLRCGKDDRTWWPAFTARCDQSQVWVRLAKAGPASHHGAEMAARVRRALGDVARGIAVGVRARTGLMLGAAAAVFALSILLPPALLSVARKPVDYFTFNPWLKRLPEYLASDVPREQKIAKLPDLALFWFSADSPFGGTEWGYAVDVRDLGRLLLTALLFGLYFALWRQRRARVAAAGWSARAARSGGVAGALASGLGLSTGPCSVMGCGAPVLPVVGLAFVGLSSTTLAVLSRLSTTLSTVLILGLLAAVVGLGGSVGRSERPAGL